MIVRPRTLLTGLAVGLAGVAVVSVLIGIEPKLHIGTSSLLYLVVVLAVASRFGGWPAVVTSVAAFVAMNWFFVEPVHTLTVGNPEEWVALLVFLFAATVTGQLAAGQRRRAEDAEHREREALVLYDTVRSIANPQLDEALREAAERLRHELDLRAVAIEIGDGAGRLRTVAGDTSAFPAVQSGGTGPLRVLAEAAMDLQDHPRRPRARWVRVIPPAVTAALSRGPRNQLHMVPILYGGRRLGSLTLVPGQGKAPFSEAENRLLTTVAVQLGQGVERARLHEEATDAEVVRRADELKTALLNAVSHDLRTPLASIIASAGSLRQDVAWTDEQVRELAEAIEQEASRLNRIVGNLLDLSRIEAGSLRCDKEWHDLGALVGDVLGRLRPVTSGRTVVVDVPDDLPFVPLDYLQIDQVLSNLVENACRYTPPGAEIGVRARQKSETIQVEVADHGPGFPAAALPRLFEPFYRGEEQPIRMSTGLGLAVARGLVEAHGGRIRAENRATGGSVIFTLPLAGPSTPPPPDSLPP